MIIYFHFRSIKAKEENGRKKIRQSKTSKTKQLHYRLRGKNDDSFFKHFAFSFRWWKLMFGVFGHDPSILCKTQNHSQKNYTTRVLPIISAGNDLKLPFLGFHASCKAQKLKSCLHQTTQSENISNFSK